MPGNPVELQYELNGYGIPSSDIPITWSGTIKTQYLKQWVRVRHLIEAEAEIDTPCIHLGDGDGGNSNLSIVECPRINDVIFKRGCTMANHPGNSHFRSMIQSQYEQLQLQPQHEQQLQIQQKETPMTIPFNDRDRYQSSSFSSSSLSSDVNANVDANANANAQPSSSSTRIIALNLIKMIKQRNGRVLVWTTNHTGTGGGSSGWWTQLKDDRQIYTKFVYSVHSFKYSTSKSQKVNRQTTTTATITTTTANNEKPNSNSNNKNTRMRSTNNSETFLFESLDGSTKRKRTATCMNVNNDNDDDDNNDRTSPSCLPDD